MLFGYNATKDLIVITVPNALLDTLLSFIIYTELRQRRFYDIDVRLWLLDINLWKLFQRKKIIIYSAVEVSRRCLPITKVHSQATLTIENSFPCWERFRFLWYERGISFCWRSQIPRSMKAILCSESILLHFLDTVRLASMAPGKIGVAYLYKDKPEGRPMRW